MRQEPYDFEGLLQRLLADHPALLGLTGDAPGQLLLINRVRGVPDSQDASDRWSLDHLFVDREGVPVLVEVKRATNTEVRRQVVAQMLDYAAHGTAYWPIDQLRDDFINANQQAGKDPEAVLADFLEAADPEAFWLQVEANLRAGRVRMIFVSDRIPPELRRIVEFLNEQMRPATVLAVEVEQFVGRGGIRTLVPRLIGNTQRAQAGKSVQCESPLSETALLDEFDPDARAGAVRLLQWLRDSGVEAGMAGGRRTIGVKVRTPDGKSVELYSIDRNKTVCVAISNLSFSPAFADEPARDDALARYRSVPGLQLTRATQFPSFPSANLTREETWKGFQDVTSNTISRLQTVASPKEDPNQGKSVGC